MRNRGCQFLLVVVVAIVLSQSVFAQWGYGQSRRQGLLNHPRDWYGNDEAARIAENLLLYQNDNGGWPKNIDMTRELDNTEKEHLRETRNASETIIDNGATYTQIRFLSLEHATTGDERYAAAAQRGIEFLLSAQYDNGGWPMIFPLRKGYYSHITFNDGAMIGAMKLLRDVAAGEKPYDFVDAATRERSQRAIEKGLSAILKCQVVVDGRPTVWCAQHDEVDFRPQKARSYELPSLSGAESVGVVEYLMDIDNPSPEVKRAIEGAVAWFQAAKIEGLAVKWIRDPETGRPVDRVAVEDPSAGPLWARFYDIDTNRPMFVGRDGVVHDHLADIEQERRRGYVWLGDWPLELLEKEYPAWRAKLNR